MPYYNKGVQVEKNAVYIKLQSSVGIVVMWNGEDAVMVNVYKCTRYLSDSFFFSPKPNTEDTTRQMGNNLSATSLKLQTVDTLMYFKHCFGHS